MLGDSTSFETLTVCDHQDDVTSIRFSPSDDILASSSSDATVRLWKVSPGRENRLLPLPECIGILPHPRAVGGVTWSGTGLHIATACDDQSVRVWHAQGGR